MFSAGEKMPLSHGDTKATKLARPSDPSSIFSIEMTTELRGHSPHPSSNRMRILVGWHNQMKNNR
jgi:hypothetical protein